MKYCTKCGRELSDDVKFCPQCGNPIPEDQNVVYVTPTPNTSTYTGTTLRRNGLALAGFICSLASLVLGGLLVAIVGIVLCAVANRKKNDYKEWNAFIKPGIVVGIVSLVLYAIAIIVALIILTTTL